VPHYHPDNKTFVTRDMRQERLAGRSGRRSIRSSDRTDDGGAAGTVGDRVARTSTQLGENEVAHVPHYHPDNKTFVTRDMRQSD
jgi:hypothetical protein